MGSCLAKMQLAGKSDRDCKINAPKTSEMIACWKGLCEADSDISEIPTSCLISLSTHPFTVSPSSSAASDPFLLFVLKTAIGDFDPAKLDHQRVDCISLKSITEGGNGYSSALQHCITPVGQSK